VDLASLDKLLTTTRSVRKRLDLTCPVEHHASRADQGSQFPVDANEMLCRQPVQRSGTQHRIHLCHPEVGRPTRGGESKRRRP
jgi:hypothetical protein